MPAPDDDRTIDGAHTDPEPVNDPYVTQATTARNVSASSRRYTILRTHQQGGLGLVSIARDSDFNREVAFKEILPASADDEHNRRRFVREAEITGALEHPGIVPVYSLGAFEDGRPYYAMRFVHGVDMQQAIERLHAADEKERPLRFRQLLGRFVDVCETIHYAHSRGVLHRDLKPSNIMLGDYGETIVVDWGLAKASGDTASVDETIDLPVQLSGPAAADMTAAGRSIGTPIYMSPEQAEGRLDRMGARTDVYGLGATLYELLSGKPPFDPHQQNLMTAVRTGACEPLERRAPAVPKPLAKVCEKAMAQAPDDRYETAGDLAMEIERWLADEPVGAYDDPLNVRVRRWVRRRWTLVLNLVTAAAVTLVALALGVAMLTSANARITTEKNRADSNLTESISQRKRAEKNATLARRAVEDYFLRVSQETLLSQPGMQPLRNELLQQALGYYEAFLAESSDDPKLQAEAATARYYVGKITEVIKGPEAALPHFEQALEVQDKLFEENGDSIELTADLARTLNALGVVYQKLSRPDDSISFYEQAIELREQLAEADPNSAESARELANSVMNVGLLFVGDRQWEPALENLRHAQAIRQAHVSSDAKTPLALRRDLGKGSYNLARALEADQQTEQAATELKEAINHFQIAEALESGDVATDESLAACHRALADIHAAAGDFDKAIEAYDEAAYRMDNLMVRNPGVPKFSHDMAGVLMNMGELQSRLGNTDEAVESIQQAVVLLDLPDGQTPLPRRRRDMAVALRRAGQLLVVLKKQEEGIENLKASQALLKALVREHPSQAEYSRELSLTNEAIKEAEKAVEATKPKQT